MRTFAEKAKATQHATSRKVTTRSRSPLGYSHEVNAIFQPQRTIGDPALQRFRWSSAEEGRAVVGMNSPHSDHSPSRIRVTPPSGGVQTKLAINRPGDECEQEADRVAEQIMSTSEPNQHAYAYGGACPECKAEQPSQESRRLQTKRVRAGDTAQIAAPPVVHAALQTPGQPLRPATRAFMETRFDHDFSRVQVHTDAKAAEAGHAIGALAFTVGQDIVFQPGAFCPETTAGRRLLAHELTHVVQQTRSDSGPLVQRYEGPEHQDLGDRYLRELLTFLQTDEGARWAGKLGLKRDDLVAQMLSDPMLRGARISLGRRVNAENSGVKKEGLTPGEAIALMGDFYATVEQLANAPDSELGDILKVMQGERAGTVSDAAERYEEITGGRYLELAARNDTHFARLNKTEWRRLHKEAIAEAQAARRQQSEERFQRALLIDAAAGHFLTDAYAAGHLFDKYEVLAAITLHLRTHPAKTRNPQTQFYVGMVAGKLPQLVLKNLHDRMNREGFEVANAHGMRWRTFGDNYLELAQETQRVAALAVFLSRQQVVAARDGQIPNPDEVEALMPDEDSVQRATQQAILYIPDAVAEVEGLIYRNRSLAPSQFASVLKPKLGPVLGANVGFALGVFVESNLTTIGHPGRERQIVEMLESARRIGFEGPVAPSLTLTSWK